MKLKFVGLLLMVVFGVLAVQASEPADFDLPPGYRAERIFTPPLQAPIHVAISPSDVIVVTDWGASDRVVQVHEDGTLSTYAAPSSDSHSGIVFDSAGNLYVADGPGILWKITPDGAATEFASGVAGGQLDIAPSGDIYAVNDSTIVQRITPDGQVSVYVTGLTSACDLAVSPVTSDVYVMDRGVGAVFKANPDGTVTLLTSGLTTDWSCIAFSPDGTLYHTDTGLFIISTVDGTRTELTWVKDSLANFGPTDIAFDSRDRVVAVDCACNHVVRFDLNAETMEMLWQGMGNTEALAVAPGGGGVYLGVSHPSSDGQGGVVRIEADGSTTPFVDGLLPEVCGMAFDADGVGYTIATGLVGGEWRSKVYSITPSGITTTLTILPYHGYSLAVDPATGYLWGASFEELWYLDDTGARHTIPTTSLGGGAESITFTPDGTLYISANTSDIFSSPVERGVYRVDPTGPTFTLIADLSTVNMCCVMGRIGAGQDGNIYWVGFGDRHTPENDPDIHMLRITPAGEVTLFGHHLPMDPAAVTGDPDSTDLYFSSGCGVYRVFEAETPGTLYVDGITGSDTGNNCQNPAAPCQSIAHATSQAWEGDTIRVAQGVYAETLTINVSVTLQGGYEAAGWTRNITLCETIIDGNQSGSVVTFQSNSSGAVLDGFTITGGEGEGAGGVDASDAVVTIRNCLIRNNWADGAPTHSAGGAVLGGGGGNQLAIINSRIIDNEVNQGAGGIRVYDGTLVMTNTLVADNQGDVGIHLNGNASLMNVTVANNEGDLIFNPLFSATLTIINSIFYSNGWTFDNCPDGQTCQISYSDFEGVIWPGTGNISTDPLFVNPAIGDYHLQAGSPCIDTGTNQGAPEVDFEGDPRPFGDSVDMGADEWWPLPAVTLNADQAGAGPPGTDVAYVFAVTNTGNYTDTISLEVSGVWTPTLDVDTTGPLSAGGSLAVTLAVSIPPGAANGASDVATLTATSGWSEAVSDSAQATTTARWYKVYLPVTLKNFGQ